LLKAATDAKKALLFQTPTSQAAAIIVGIQNKIFNLEGPQTSKCTVVNGSQNRERDLQAFAWPIMSLMLNVMLPAHVSAICNKTITTL